MITESLKYIRRVHSRTPNLNEHLKTGFNHQGESFRRDSEDYINLRIALKIKEK